MVTSGSFLKQISNINAEALENFLQGIGFTKVADKTFKFQKTTEASGDDQ